VGSRKKLAMQVITREKNPIATPTNIPDDISFLLLIAKPIAVSTAITHKLPATNQERLRSRMRAGFRALPS
jgi:hypothetical protein